MDSAHPQAIVHLAAVGSVAESHRDPEKTFAVNNPERVRPVEIPVLIGDPSRLCALGWGPKRDVTAALRDVLEEHGAG